MLMQDDVIFFLHFVWSGFVDFRFGEFWLVICGSHYALRFGLLSVCNDATRKIYGVHYQLFCKVI